MQYTPQPAASHRTKKRKPSTAISIFLIALSVLAIAYFLLGEIIFGGGGAEPQPLAMLPASDIPTDAAGNNLVGNHMDNLQNGGLFTMQGDRIFFANPDDGGCLYTGLRQDGAAVKLTDFAVANLNVSGDRLIFTDLRDSFYLENGEARKLTGSDPLEIAAQIGAGDSAALHFGGNLYLLEGVLDYDGGERAPPVPLAEGRSVGSPIVADGIVLALMRGDGGGLTPMSAAAQNSASLSGLVRPMATDLVRTAAGPDDALQIVILTEDDVIDLGVTTPSHPSAVTVLVYPDIAYAELQSADPAAPNQIVRFDYRTGEAEGVLSGCNLREAWGHAVFLSFEDGLIYAIDPDTGEIAPVSSVVCPKDFFIDQNGNMAFYLTNGGAKESAHVVISRDNPLPNEKGKKVQPAETTGDWHTYINPYEPKGSALVYRVDDVRIKYTFEREIVICGPQNPPPLPPPIGRPPLEPPPQSQPESRWESEPESQPQPESQPEPQSQPESQPEPQSQPESPEEELPLDIEAFAGESDPAAQLRAQLLLLQGVKYSDPRVCGVFTPGQYDMVVDFYGGSMSIAEALADQLYEIFALEVAGSDRDTNMKALAKAMEHCISLAEFTVDNVGDRSLPFSAEVTITVTRRVDLKKFSNNLNAYYLKAIQGYPGGQQALVAKGQEYFNVWALGVFTDVLNNPEAHDLISDGPESRTILLSFRDSAASYQPATERACWVLFAGQEGLDALAKLLMQTK